MYKKKKSISGDSALRALSPACVGSMCSVAESERRGCACGDTGTCGCATTCGCAGTCAVARWTLLLNLARKLGKSTIISRYNTDSFTPMFLVVQKPEAIFGTRILDLESTLTVQVLVLLFTGSSSPIWLENKENLR